MKSAILLCGLSLLASSASASPQTSSSSPDIVKIEWQSPEKYQDIRPAQELKSAFHRRTFAQFDRIFTDLAKELPEGYRWEVTVTNVDLAGEVRPTQGAGGGMIRIVRPIFFPQMALSFKVIASDNTVVLEDKAEIKDMNFSNHIRRVRMNEPLFYEKLMLKRWFKKDVIAKL